MTTQQLNIDASQAITELQKVNEYLKMMTDNQNKVSEASKKAGEETKKEAEKATTGLQGMIDKMAKFITMQKHTDVTKSFVELKAQIDVIKGAIGSALTVWSSFRDTIEKYETRSTQKTALNIMSEHGKELNDVLSKTLELTRGVVGGSDLRPTVNKLVSQEFDLNAASLEKLIKVSSIYASAVGEEVAPVMERLALASQMERDRTFAKMGVYVNHTKVIEEYAKKNNILVENLSKQERINILLDASVNQLSERYAKMGLTLEALESPITLVMKRSDAYVSKAKQVMVDTLGELYVTSVEMTENMFSTFEEVGEVFAAWIESGQEGATRVKKKYADRRYWIQQEEVKKSIELSERQHIEESELYKKYAEQQIAYGVKNKDLIYIQYLELIEKLKAEQGSKTVFINYKLMNVDYEKTEAFRKSGYEFSEADVEKMQRQMDYKNQKQKEYQSKLDAINNETKSVNERIQDSYIQDEVQREQAKYDRMFDDYVEFSEKKVKKTELYNAKLLLLQAKAEEQGIILNKIINKQEEEAYKQSEKEILVFEKQKKKREEDERLEKIAKEKEMYFALANVRNAELNLYDYQAEQRQKIKDEEHKILLQQEKAYQDKAKSYLFDAANSMYSGLISGRESFLQETIALSMQRAGAEIFNDGLIGLWQGGRWALSPYPTMAAQGVETIGYSLAEVAAGIGLGYAGAKIMPDVGGKSESKNKETASRDRSMTNNTEQKQKIVTYLYPDERTAIQQLSKVNKKM